jgi:hypothetical protein
MTVLTQIRSQNMYFPIQIDNVDDLALSLGYQPTQFIRMCRFCGLISDRGVHFEEWKRSLRYSITPDRFNHTASDTPEIINYFRFDGPILVDTERSSRSSLPMLPKNKPNLAALSVEAICSS